MNLMRLTVFKSVSLLIKVNAFEAMTFPGALHFSAIMSDIIQ
jgi:hypothetical protein